MVQRLSSLEDLASHLTSVATVFTTGCAAEVAGLSALLASVQTSVSVSGIFIPGVNRCDYTALSAEARCETFFMTPQLSASIQTGRVDYSPWRYRDVVQRYSSSPVDVALVMLSQPNAEGCCSYGVTSDYAPIVLPQARIKVGVINRQMPVIPGESVHIDTLDFVVEINEPLIEVRSAPIDDISTRIASFVAGFIEDNATVQLGLGSIPGAVAAEIGDRRNLKVRSGLIDASVLALEEAGALCPATPILGGVALGEAGYYACLDNNQRFNFRRVSETHNIADIAATNNFIAVNGALEVDLLGQVNSCVLPNGYISGPGGLPEFVSGALLSKGGRSIIALNSAAKAGTISRVVGRLQGAMPSIGMTDADVVVTEYGVAQLRGKSLTERVRAMISVAHPEHREFLESESPVPL